LLKPHFGKQDKVIRKNFTEIEAELFREVPGPVYNVMNDLSKQFPFNKGRFLKAPRTQPDTVTKKKEKLTPSPAAYNNLDAFLKTEPNLKGNFKQ
jgi:hypothetical protein